MATEWVSATAAEVQAMSADELIERYHFELCPASGSDGERQIGIQPWRKECVAESRGYLAILAPRKQELIDALDRRQAVKNQRQAEARAEAEAARNARLAALEAGEPFMLIWREGEYLSGWQAGGPDAEVLAREGAGRDVDGWGFSVAYGVVETLGQAFTLTALREFLAPVRAAEAARAAKAAVAQTEKDARRQAFAVVHTYRLAQPRGGENGTDGLADLVVRETATGTDIHMIAANVFDFGYYAFPARVSGTDEVFHPERWTPEERQAREWLMEFPPIDPHLRM